MTTTVVKVIGTGGDFTTLQAWEDAAPANLVTADEVWQGQLKNQLFSGTGAQLTISGSTSDATRYKQLICQTGASFKDNANVQTNALRFNSANGAAITGTSGYTTTVTVTEDFVRLDGLQINATNNSGSSLLVSNQGVQLTHSILEHKASDGGCNFSSTAGLLQNCLIVGRKASMTSILKIGSVTSMTINGVTIALPTGLTAATAAINGNYRTAAFNGIAVFGCTAVKSGTSLTDTFTRCCTDVASPPTGFTGSLAYTTATFQAVADGSHDYRDKTGSALVNAGVTTTGFTDDIVGTARGANPDCGCWQLVSSGTWKTTNGLSTASIKTVDALAKASIKTNNGLTP